MEQDSIAMNLDFCLCVDLRDSRITQKLMNQITKIFNRNLLLILKLDDCAPLLNYFHVQNWN